MKKEKLARWMHEEYEKNAKKKGWKTQDSEQVDFDDLLKARKDVLLWLAQRLIIKFAQDNKK